MLLTRAVAILGATTVLAGSAWGTNITVVVTPSAAAAAADVVSDFLLANPTYTVTLIGQSDAVSRDTILAGAAPYDLLLAQSPLIPLQLRFFHPELIVGDPFPYARDTLVLFSITTDISRGLPPDPEPFALPDPRSLDPYGLATVESLRGRYHRAEKKGLTVKTEDASASYASVEFLGTAYGFTGKSQICSAVTGVEEYEAGSFHHEYRLGRDYFTDIVLTGIRVAATRDSDQETELADFITFLGAGGGSTLEQHCYQLPSAATLLAAPHGNSNGEEE